MTKKTLNTSIKLHLGDCLPGLRGLDGGGDVVQTDFLTTGRV